MKSNSENHSDNKVIVIPPQISEETMKRMAEFFMKTSVPRILAKEQEKERYVENLERTIRRGKDKNV